MVKYYIYIIIDKNSDYFISGKGNTLFITIGKETPFDKLSKKFNKYTHGISYKEVNTYTPRDYELYIYDPNAIFYNYIHTFYYPGKKIKSVDLYFRVEDQANRNPLVVGFNDVDGNTLYYTYYHLYYKGSSTHGIGQPGSFRKDDLVTRLIEESGRYDTSRKYKFVIRLGEKPNRNEFKYPNGGHNQEMITVSKSDVSECKDFEMYEHSINPRSSVQSFYVSFNDDSLYMIGDPTLKKLQSVEVYYYKPNTVTPVIIIFKFENENFLYKYSNLKHDLENSKEVNISKLDKFNSDQLSSNLEEEGDKLKKKIEFRKGPGRNENILTTEENIGTKFKKITFLPDTTSTLDGPYVFFSKNLVTLKSRYYGVKNDFKDEYLDSLYGKEFDSIEYYKTGHDIALVIGFISKSIKKYFKKIDKDPKSWKEEQITYSSNDELVKLLAAIQKEVESSYEEELKRESAKQLVEQGHTQFNKFVGTQKPTNDQTQDLKVNQNQNATYLNDNKSVSSKVGSTIGVLILIGIIGGGGYWWYKRRFVGYRSFFMILKNTH